MSTPRTCEYPECGRDRRGRRWCNSHQRQHDRHGIEDMRPIGQPKQPRRSSTPCRVDGCGRAVMGRGLCSGHLRRDREGLPLDPIIGRAQKTPCVMDCGALTESPTGHCPRCREKLRRLGLLPGQVITPCTGPGCDKPGFGDPAMCESHKRQWRETGTLWEIRRAVVGCAFAGCDRDHAAKGYCTQHARQLRDRGGDTGRLTPIGQRETRACTIDGCDGDHVARGLCRRHYNAAAYGSIPKPPKSQHGPRPLKPVKATKSRLPAGWDKPAPKPAAPKRAGGSGTSESTLLYMTPVTPPLPEQVEAVLALIADQPDADLLADMLGLEAA